MADTKISDLTALTGANVAADDEFVIVDTSAAQSKRITRAELAVALGTNDTLADVLGKGNTTGGTDIAVSTGDDITFADNSKAIFGAGSDLQIYHDGSHSRISDVGTGNLRLRGTDVRIESNSGVDMLSTVDGAGVTLYYNNAAKLSTTSTGIDVTGTVTADGLTVDGIGSFTQAGGGLRVINNGTAGHNANIFFGLANQTDGWTIGQGVTANDGVFRLYDNGAGNVKMSVTSGGDISFYDSTGTSQNLFWDASASKLGIGTTSPSTTLHLSSSGTALRLQDTDTNAYAEISTSDQGALVLEADKANGQAGTTMLFKVDGSEVGRWDSSGNLLVGKTSQTIDTVGAELLGSIGKIQATRDGGASGGFNRKTSDGNIVEFYKDGTTVGSIASGSSGTEFKWYGAFASGAGLGIYSNLSVRPLSNTGAAADGTVTLGHSSQRFKDLYLSGGVYLGGTGAANHLDDYEEGTFAPTILGSVSNPTVTYSSQNGKYLKIGNLVWVSVSFHTSAVSGGSGAALLGNLPFTATGTVYGQLSGGLVNVDVDNATYSLVARVGSSSTTASFQQYRDNTNDSNVQVGDLSGGTKFYQYSGCYSTQ